MMHIVLDTGSARWTCESLENFEEIYLSAVAGFIDSFPCARQRRQLSRLAIVMSEAEFHLDDQ